jgi:hypothetical protein
VNRAPRMLTFFAVLALIACLAGAADAKNKQNRGKPIPPELNPPASAVMIFELGASGVQIYTCQAKADAPNTYEWAFKAPEATLYNARGQVVGTHYAGPTWEGQDGSTIVGAVVARADAPSRKAIPWLLLEAKDNTGAGVFSGITHIQRLATVGGVAPTKGCDAAHAGEEARVPYKATYVFYYPAASTS